MNAALGLVFQIGEQEPQFLLGSGESSREDFEARNTHDKGEALKKGDAAQCSKGITLHLSSSNQFSLQCSDIAS